MFKEDPALQPLVPVQALPYAACVLLGAAFLLGFAFTTYVSHANRLASSPMQSAAQAVHRAGAAPRPRLESLRWFRHRGFVQRRGRLCVNRAWWSRVSLQYCTVHSLRGCRHACSGRTTTAKLSGAVIPGVYIILAKVPTGIV